MARTRLLLQILMTSVFAGVAAIGTLTAQSAAKPPADTSKLITYATANKATYLKFADETEGMLRRDVLNVWFPRTVDHEHGGFYSNFARDWQPTKSQGKFSVFQGRMTWVAAQIVMRRPDLKDQ